MVFFCCYQPLQTWSHEKESCFFFRAKLSFYHSFTCEMRSYLFQQTNAQRKAKLQKQTNFSSGRISQFEVKMCLFLNLNTNTSSMCVWSLEVPNSHTFTMSVVLCWRKECKHNNVDKKTDECENCVIVTTWCITTNQNKWNIIHFFDWNNLNDSAFSILTSNIYWFIWILVIDVVFFFWQSLYSLIQTERNHKLERIV